MLSADERYLCGHYLAYLLGGSRRQGIFLQRPLDPRNADRARLMLAMTWLMIVGPVRGATSPRPPSCSTPRPDVRPALNPIVVMKYLASRDTPGQAQDVPPARKRLQEASAYAQKRDARRQRRAQPRPDAAGARRPRARSRPKRDEVDDQLVEPLEPRDRGLARNADFRQAVLRYATQPPTATPPAPSSGPRSFTP